MKVTTPSSAHTFSPGTDPQAERIMSVRNIRMNTNASPERIDGPIGQETPETPKEPIISDDIVDKTEANPTAEATQPISPQFAALAKQRRALQQERRAFEDAKKAFEESKSQGGASIDIARLKSDPVGVFLEAGITYDQLADAIIERQSRGDPEALDKRLQDFEQRFDKKLTERETQRDQQARQQVVSEMTRHANQLVSNGDEFELVRETASVPDVIRLIERNYDETGEILDVKEACKLVEDELFNRNQKLIKLKKMQSLLQPQVEQNPPQQRRPGMRTLTNKDTASAPMSARARAIAAFRGELKK